MPVCIQGESYPSRAELEARLRERYERFCNEQAEPPESSRAERKRRFVEKAYFNRTCAGIKFNHVDFVEDAAKAFDYIESIND